MPTVWKAHDTRTATLSPLFSTRHSLASPIRSPAPAASMAGARKWRTRMGREAASGRIMRWRSSARAFRRALELWGRGPADNDDVMCSIVEQRIWQRASQTLGAGRLHAAWVSTGALDERKNVPMSLRNTGPRQRKL